MIERIYGREHALSSLRPNSQFIWNDDGLTWLDTENTVPSDAELDAEVIRLQTAWDALKYQRQRAEEYPDWGTQLDYIYHNGIDKWKTDIVDPVKAKYPKPS